MSDEIIPRLQKHFKTPVIIHKTVQVYGIPESQLALELTDWEMPFRIICIWHICRILE